jgi:hypothetical protein
MSADNTVPKIVLQLVKGTDESYKNTKLETYLQTELDKQVPNQDNWEDAKEEFGTYLQTRDNEFKKLTIKYNYLLISNIVIGSIVSIGTVYRFIRNFRQH